MSKIEELRERNKELLRELKKVRSENERKKIIKQIVGNILEIDKINGYSSWRWGRLILLNSEDEN